MVLSSIHSKIQEYNFEEKTSLEIERIEKEYDQLLHIYKQLENEAKHVLEHLLKINNIKIHNILSRVKTKESFIEKVIRKQIKDPWNEIKDVVGLRIVCLFLSDIEIISNIINDNFEIIEEDNKIINPQNANTFGYMSAHYILQLKQQYTGPRYDSIKSLHFEIQIRTISMDAWANISHFLEYKNERDIPPQLKKDFNVLSGLFYVADTHFEMLNKERQENNEHLSQNVEMIISNDYTNAETPLNLDSLKLYLSNKIKDRKPSTSKSISELVNELSEVGYTTIEQLDKQVNSGWNAFLEMEKNDSGNKFQDVGVIRMLLGIVDKEYREYKYGEDSNHKNYAYLIEKNN